MHDSVEGRFHRQMTTGDAFGVIVVMGITGIRLESRR